MSDLQSLIERVEKATGGHDPWLAFDFFEAIEADDRQRDIIGGARDRVTRGALKEEDLFAWRTFEESASARAILSASIDAALSLGSRVLPGWEWTLWSNGSVILFPHCQAHQHSHRIEADGETAALAICLALLKAVQAQANNDATEETRG